MGNPLNVKGGNGKCGIVRFFAGVPGVEGLSNYSKFSFVDNKDLSCALMSTVYSI